MHDTMTLADAPVGVEATLIFCLAEPALRSRLSTLGLRCGAPVAVVRRTGGGGGIVGVAGARIALDKSLLQTLHVRVVSGVAA